MVDIDLAALQLNNIKADGSSFFNHPPGINVRPIGKGREDYRLDIQPEFVELSVLDDQYGIHPNGSQTSNGKPNGIKAQRHEDYNLEQVDAKTFIDAQTTQTEASGFEAKNLYSNATFQTDDELGEAQIHAVLREAGLLDVLGKLDNDGLAEDS
ncbi:hypothetical protein ACOME3_006049 [Neoechinorhynchus agilis]